jgi:hypothetical protein
MKIKSICDNYPTACTWLRIKAQNFLAQFECHPFTSMLKSIKTYLNTILILTFQENNA